MRFDVHPTMMKQKQGAPLRTHPENLQTIAICTTGLSPSGRPCFSLGEVFVDFFFLFKRTLLWTSVNSIPCA